MKLKVLPFLFLIGLIFGCKQEEKFIDPSDNPAITRKFKVVSPKTPDYVNRFDKNLDVIWETSYFHVSKDSMYLKLETPVSNLNFYVRNIYFYEQGLYTVIFVHVSDGDIQPTRLEKKNFLLQGKVPFKDIADMTGHGNEFKPNKEEWVLIIIYNGSNLIPLGDKVRPEEAGGGVIVGRP